MSENPDLQGPKLQTADFNGDGAPDVIVVRNPGSVLLAETESTVEIPFLNLLTNESSRNALEGLKEQLGRVNSESANIGAQVSRLETAFSNLNTRKLNLEASRSQIQDVDIAVASASLVKDTILQQTAAAVLSQANLQSRIVLSLLEI